MKENSNMKKMLSFVTVENVIISSVLLDRGQLALAYFNGHVALADPCVDAFLDCSRQDAQAGEAEDYGCPFEGGWIDDSRGRQYE